MYLMYVDESGDAGLVNSPTSHFALSALVIHETRWRNFVDAMVAFRRTMRLVHSLPIRTEIHASEYLRSPPVPNMPRYVRLAILRNLLDELAKLDYVSITNVVVSNAGKPAGYDVFERAWQAMFQRFEDTMRFGNFPGGFRNDTGMVLTDATDGRKLVRLVRRMQVFNPIPNQVQYGPGYRNKPLLRIIEDPHAKDSRDSLFIQACDVSAYFLMQHFRPSSFVRKASAQNYLHRLDPILNKKASSTHARGIVVL